MRTISVISPDTQKGAILVIVLVLLLVMTLIGVSAMQNTALEEQMAGNFADRNMAFQASESGLRDASEWIQGFLTKPDATANGSSDIWSAGSIAADPADSQFDWASKGINYGDKTNNSANEFSTHYAAPSFVVEETAFIPDGLDPEARARGQGINYYTVSSIGRGGSDSAESVLQVVYEKRFN